MTEPVVIGNATLYLGDCLEILRTLPDSSVDSVVTDPPYGLSREPDMAEVLRHWLAGDDYVHRGRGFMGKSWDSFVPGPAVWRECLRVLKPGGHLLAFFGTRTQDIGTLAIRLAGFEIRDSIAWVYGSGFPKSLDVSKAIDKAAGAEREVVGVNEDYLRRKPNGMKTAGASAYGYSVTDLPTNADVTAPATPDAERWQGWGTALKPALEPITLARKPLVGTVAANVLAHGTGALNIDGCRVEGVPPSVPQPDFRSAAGRATNLDASRRNGEVSSATGRWPANLIHDGSDEVVALFPSAPGQQGDISGSEPSRPGKNTYGEYETRKEFKARREGEASAARFFYCAKASRADRNAGCDGLPQQPSYMVENGSRTAAAANGVRYDRTTVHGNNHPTVKPTDLMRWLCRLVTPAGGLVLDPFTGSGSTGKGALAEGFEFIGVEQDPAYFDIACRRIEDAQRQGRLIA